MLLRLAAWSVLFVVFMTGLMMVPAADSPLPDRRAEAAKLFKDGNYKEAYEIARSLVLAVDNSGEELAGDLKLAHNCLRQLQQDAQIDELLDAVLEAHPDNFYAYWAMARQLMQSPHYGYIVAGEFQRGHQRGGGEYASSDERDRVQALAWMMHAETRRGPDTLSARELGRFYDHLATYLRHGRHGSESWKLQDLTDLSSLPDYEIGDHYGYGENQGAPVDEEGTPVYYDIGESFEAAQNDGERWRWALQQVSAADPGRDDEIRFEFAQFARQEFGVRTLQEWGVRLPQVDEESSGDAGTWALHTLQENETIARLASGVKRFVLREDYNYIKTYRELAEKREGTRSEWSYGQLAEIFEDRQQYTRAAQMWRASIAQHGDRSRNKNKTKRLQQIINNWGQLEPGHAQPAGRGATIDYRFRNGDEVSFVAYELNVEQLLTDIQNSLKSGQQATNWQQIQIDNIGWRVVNQNELKYRGEKVAEWSLDLQPRPGHFDRRVTVTTPLQRAGAYLLIAKMTGGNTSRCVIWLDDTAIVKKNLDGKAMYFVADAVTGQPIDKMKVEFFGWQQERIDNTKRQYRIRTQQHADFTDLDGMIVTHPRLMETNLNWMAIAKDNTGRLAYLGFNRVWYGEYLDQPALDSKSYLITDRPVYRPNQTVKFKFWIRKTEYGSQERSVYGNMDFVVHINDPQGTEVFKQTFKTDEFGGISGEFALPDDAKLGQYHIYALGKFSVGGGGHFRVEEYKKPEFEVIVETPEKPVELGETVTASVRAKYYFGAPVTDARVNIKVERSKKETRWYPVTRWDWLYGNGYWWHAADYEWYPGFSRWGCLAPMPYWWDWHPDPPELVLDRTLNIGENGAVEFEIDTSLAKTLHGDSDHEYRVSVEVTDASRRTIVGTGNIIVAREPFNVFAWTDRGHYRVGETITASFQARTVDGNGVQGQGDLKLFKISYQNGEPKETLVEQWPLNTDEQGRSSQKIHAESSGQYRLSYTVTQGENSIEGGYLFVIRGDGFDGSDYRFNALELVTDKQHYAPGEHVELLINTDRRNSTVLLFVRPLNGMYPGKPQVHRLQGKSQLVRIPVREKDRPNFFVEAMTIADGELQTAVQQIAVPPEDRVINVDVVTDAEQYQPGSPAEVQVKLTDQDGEPFLGSVVLSAYDRAVEYISGGSNVPEIREFFWNWKRQHHPHTEHSLSRYFGLLVKDGEISMANLGAFGHEVADRDGGAPDELRAGRKSRMSSRTLGIAETAEMQPMAAADAAAPGLGGGGGFGGMMGGEGTTAQQELVQPTVRQNFADTAYWNADISTNEQGLATVSFEMPENLSAWKLRAWGLGDGTRVGEGTTEVVTTKNLIVRLQAPRFLVEKDIVTISTIVHNHLQQEKSVQVAVEQSDDTPMTPFSAVGSQGVTVPAGGEVRLDWPFKVTGEGVATLTAKALTDEESDAMQIDFPVYVHGMLKTESFSGVIRPTEQAGKLLLMIPEDRRPQQTRLEIRYSPTLAGAMIDALPYLAEYPYGCTEQTLNRFIPTVITQRILQELDLDLAAIRDKQTNLNAQEIGDDQQRARQWKRFDRNPVYNAATVERMVQKGVQDLTAMQNSDGGWGWFSGFGEKSYPHTTAVVVHGLQLAQQNDVAIVDGIVERGVNWLTQYQDRQVELLEEGARRADNPKRQRPYKVRATDIDALVFSVLVDAGVVHEAMQQFLYRDRLDLSLYSQALLGLALHTIEAEEQRDMILRNLDQFLTVDDENQTAFLDLPNDNSWWYWHGNTIEANAHYLKLLSRVRPQDPKAAGLVKYILNNRKHGTYWNSTRDTAYCIEALAEYLKRSGEIAPDMTVEVWLDGERHQTVEINQENLLTFDNSFVLEGEKLTAGEHTVELRKTGKGPLYYNAYLSYFSLEDFIPRAGLEIQVQRKFYRLEQDHDATNAVAGNRGQVIDQKQLKYDRIELDNLDEVQSGDLIEVELEIDSKNDYEYIVFEDLKAAGLEPVDLRSGYTPGALGAYVEFRDERVSFFLRTLDRGKHSVRYRLRAEIPGQFSALPARASAMYAPELKANSDEMKLKVSDTE